MNFLLADGFRRQAWAAILAGFPCAVGSLLLLGFLILKSDTSAAESIGQTFLAAAGGLSLFLLALSAALLATQASARRSSQANPPRRESKAAATKEPFRNAEGIPLSRAELKQAYRRKKRESEQFLWNAALLCAPLLFAHFVLIFFSQDGNHQFLFWSLIPMALFLAGTYMAVKHHGRLEAEVKELRRQRRAAPRQSQFPV